jgi:hypothetical protein
MSTEKSRGKRFCSLFVHVWVSHCLAWFSKGQDIDIALPHSGIWPARPADLAADGVFRAGAAEGDQGVA